MVAFVTYTSEAWFFAKTSGTLKCMPTPALLMIVSAFADHTSAKASCLSYIDLSNTFDFFILGECLVVRTFYA